LVLKYSRLESLSFRKQLQYGMVEYSRSVMLTCAKTGLLKPKRDGP
jgi:hypothetical protein